MKHTKVDVNRYTDKKDEAYFDKYKLGTWFTVEELCEAKGTSAASPHA
jgi:hypothetical protein